jgi:hypothetical protein
MAYATPDARRQLLASVAAATDELGSALASLSDAYEQLDDRTADRLEAEVFGPVQMAYGRSKSTHDAFAARTGLAAGVFRTAPPGRPSTSAKDSIARAVGAVGTANQTLATLQDSMLPVEVGDAELRAGLASVRELVEPVPRAARELVRILGR